MFIRYHINVQAPYSNDVAEEDCVTEIHGDIMTFIGDSDDTIKIGEVLVDYVDIHRAKEARIPLGSLFDYASNMGARFYCDGWNKDLNIYHADITEALSGENTLLIGGLFIEPAYRGHMLGLAAIELSIQHFGHGCCVVVLEPYPRLMQFPPELSAAEIRESVVGLSTYFSRMGFFPVPNSPLMALDLDYVRPTLAEIGWEGAL